MSDTPSWLTAENVSTAASNPHAQNFAKNVASNAAVQNAVKEEAYRSANEAFGVPSYAPPTQTDPESQEVKLEDPTTGMEAKELAAMQKYATMLRVAFIIVAILMGAAAYLRLATTPSISTVFVALYVWFFALVICCFELAIGFIAKIIAENFGFMYFPTGKGVFLAFVSFLCLDLSIFGIICTCLLLVLMCVNIYVMFKFPKYDAWLRYKHYMSTSN